jgi:hypothetical protein
MRYNKKWQAICPACEKKLTHNSYKCVSCGTKGIRIRDKGFGEFSFGCSNSECERGYLSLKCKCGEEISSPTILPTFLDSMKSLVKSVA